MNYKTLYLISGGIIGVILSVILLYVTLTVSANNSNECAPGSYSIGDGICKQEPTGCPYGDSIPIDSPKCAPPQENTIEELPTPTLESKQEIQPIKESSKCNE